MTKEKKKYLDSLWFNSDIYYCLTLYVNGKTDEVEEHIKKIGEKYPGTIFQEAPKLAYYYEKDQIAEKLVQELSDLDEYDEYLKTFDDKMVQAIYDTDIFDSYLIKRLPLENMIKE